MASNNSQRGSSRSFSDSGFSSFGSTSSVNTTVTVNPRYACYWLDECRGFHEVDHCAARKGDLRGKLGIYYSPNAMYNRYSVDKQNNLSLKSNPTGRTMINLLIHRKCDDQVQVLFVTKSLTDKNRKDQADQNRQPLLALPSSNPREKEERPESVATRALETVTDRKELLEKLRPHLTRFLFVDASVVYPLFLTEERANLLTKHFTPSEEVLSLHWFPLEYVLSKLPACSNYLRQPAQRDDLAQVRHSIATTSVKLQDMNTEYNMWSVLEFYLLCIREHVQFNTFLKL